MEAARFDKLIKDLRGEDPPRVWSLLVTVFGDLAQDGSALPAAVLGEIVAPLGIKPEAMRVALHRLRKDGWIDSQRSGRSSQYALTRKGLAESVAASPRIYATCPPSEAACLMLTDPSSPPGWTDGDVWITPHAMLTARPPKGAEAFATPVSVEQTLPRWMREKVCDAETARLSADLAARLGRLASALDRAPEPTVMQGIVLRVLVVHEWRRIALKVPPLPDHVFPAPWAGSACRARVAVLLELLPRQRPATLAAALDS